MATLKVTLKTYDELAKEILKGWQYKVYLIKLRSFLTIIEKKLSHYKSTGTKDEKVFIEESDNIKFLELEKKKIEDFLYSEESEFNKEENREISALANDRIIQKLNRKARRMGANLKNKAIKTALGGSDVMGFFNRIGISITVEIDNKALSVNELPLS